MSKKKPKKAKPKAKKPKAKAPKGFDVAKFVDQLNKEAKEEIAVVGGGYARGDIQGYLSTDCLPLDLVLGDGVMGGFPLGRLVELFGSESHGKSTLATHLLKNVQTGNGTQVRWSKVKGKWRPKVLKDKMKPGLAVLLDAEATFDKKRAEKIGVDLDRLIVLNAESVEEGFDAVDRILDQAEEDPAFEDVPVLIVWDTIAASATEKELEAGMYGGGMADKPRVLRSILRKLTPRLAKTNVCLVLVNQMIDRISMPGASTPGGRGIKFHASLRIQIKKIRAWREKDRDVGIDTLAKLIKSKICVPMQEIPLPIRFRTGVDSDQSLFNYLANEIGWIGKAGSRWKIKMPGKKKDLSFYQKDWRKVLRETPGLRKKCNRAIRNYIEALEEAA